MSETPAGPWSEPPAAPAPTGPRLNATDFLTAQRANRRNTVWLIVILLLLGAGVGYSLGAFLEAYFGMAAPTATLASPLGVMLGGGMVSVGLVASAVTFVVGGKVILGITGAQDVERDAEPMLHNVVEEMAIAAGIPKPKVYLIETDVPNAFATGMEPREAAIGVTRGLLTTLNREELQGVIGHETGHIVNWDTRYMTAVAILVGLIALVCDGARRMLWYGGGSGDGRNRKGSAGPLLLIFLLFAILAPIAAQLVRFAVSRQREYLADATAVKLTRNPLGLIGALQKLEALARPFKGANRATQHMFIVNPIREFGADVGALMATHPPLEARIKRLRNLGRV
ncbi:MAG: M48 family metallopeptidase [Dongiaceae bacterium]